MPLNANKVPNSGGGLDAPKLEPGGYPARLVQVVDMGLQPQRPYKGEDKPPAYMIRTTYELPEEFMLDEDGNEDKEKPRWVHEELPLHPLNSNLAKSTKRMLALDPELESDGDWTKLLGKPVILNLVINESKGRVYTNIDSTSVIRQKIADNLPELVNEPIAFDQGSADVEQFLRLSKYMQDKIKGGLEFEGSALAKALEKSSSQADQGKTEIVEQDDWED